MPADQYPPFVSQEAYYKLVVRPVKRCKACGGNECSDCGACLRNTCDRCKQCPPWEH
jgi:hypothetical protein